MRMKAAAAVAVAGVGALLLSACGVGGGGGDATASGNFADCPENINTCNEVPADQLQDGGTITFAIEKNIANWNVNSAEGNVFETGMATKAFLPCAFNSTPELTTELNTDLMVSAELTNPTTAVYKIKPEATWSDGTPIGTADFVYAWKAQDARECPDCASAGNGGYDQIADVVGSDGGKTVTLTLERPYTDWQSFFGSNAPLYPAHIAAQQGDINTPAGLASSFEWLGANTPTYSGGPFTIQSWENNQALTLVPNERWYGATQPRVDTLILRVVTDATQEPIALQNNEVQVLYPQPQVDIVTQIQQIPGVSQVQQLGLTWEHFDLNLRNPVLQDTAARTWSRRTARPSRTCGSATPSATRSGRASPSCSRSTCSSWVSGSRSSRPTTSAPRSPPVSTTSWCSPGCSHRSRSAARSSCGCRTPDRTSASTRTRGPTS